MVRIEHEDAIRHRAAGDQTFNGLGLTDELHKLAVVPSGLRSSIVCVTT
jgi:hypothetical protein